MHWKSKRWTLIGMLLLVVSGVMMVTGVAATAQAAPIATTQVTDTVYRGDGTLASGSVLVSWQAFTTASGEAVPGGDTSTPITGGALNVALVPNAGSTPMGTHYTAVYHLDDGSVSREFWVVPASQVAVPVSTIRSTVLPISVAMQTVSKSYVDTAIAAAVTGHPLDSSNPFVEKGGDRMTGPLVLPGDPAAANQAADKHYVDVSVANAASGLGLKTQVIAGATADYNFLQGSGAVLTDNTGNGNNGVLGSGTNAPTWVNGGLSFTLPQNVNLPASLNGTRTFYLAFYLNPLPTSVAQFVPQAFPMLVGSTLGNAGLNIVTDSSQDQGSLPAFAPGTVANGNYTSMSNLFISGFNVLTVTLGTGVSGDVDRLYINGVETPYAFQQASFGAQSSGNLLLGASNTGLFAGSGFSGIFYRAVFAATEDSAATIQANYQKILSDINSRSVPVVPVPVEQTIPQLYAVGDSITYGFGTSNPAVQAWPFNLALTNQPNYHVVDMGLMGVSFGAIAGSETNRVGTLCNTLNGPSIAIAFSGTNDFASSATPAIVFGRLASWVQTVKRAGCRAFVGTMISRQTLDSDKDAYDALILQDAQKVGADGVIDFAANLLLGADGSSANTTYFQADQTHPTAAGQLLLAAAASNALNYYFGYTAANPHVITASAYAMAAADGYVTAKPTANQILTLPDCTGQSGAVYMVANLQSAFTVGVVAGSASQLINGRTVTTIVAVPANGSLTLRDVPNPKTTSGCHWEM